MVNRRLKTKSNEIIAEIDEDGNLEERIRKIVKTEMVQQNATINKQLLEFHELSKCNLLLLKMIEELKQENQVLKEELASKSKDTDLKNNDKKIFEIIRQHEAMKEKEKSIVIVGLAERDSDSNTEAQDAALIKNIAENVGVEKQVISVSRYGYRSVKPRIIKVKFTDKEASMSVIKSSTARQLLPKGAFIRRNMTVEELEQDRQLRKECYNRNEAANLYKFVVRNSKIIELKEPRPWVPRRLVVA